MAVHDETNTPSQAAAFEQQARARAQAASQAAPQPAPQQRHNHSMGTISPRLRSGFAFGSPIGKGIGNEYMNKIAENLREIYKNADTDYKISVNTIDNVNEPGSYFSLILVCMEADATPNVVTIHTLVVEATGNPIPPYYKNIDGEQVEILRVSGQALDGKLANIVKEKMSGLYAGRNIRLIAGEVIPRDFNPEDKYAMHLLALNSAFACGTELLTSSAGFSDLNLAKESRDSTLIVNLGFAPNQIKNVVGEPMRSDVLIQFSSQNRNQKQQDNSVNSGDRDIKISELSAFVDLVWNPAIPSNPFGLPYQNIQLPPGVLATQKYSARAVVTNLASENSYTPGSLLLALSTVSMLNERNNWVQAFRPQATSGDVDFHDIGAMNIEANIYREEDKNGYGTPINTKASNFSLEMLGQYIGAIIGNGLMISMDCPETGTQSWYMSLFSAAEQGSEVAMKVIVDSANELTNGAFSKHFTPGSPMFTDQNNVIHMGYWTDKTGQRRDIRDVDTVFVANVIGERNPVMIREWQDTFLLTNFSLDKRLAERKKMIMGLTNETAVFTGFARRVTFSSMFLAALAMGIRETGLTFNVRSPLSGNMQENRGFASFAGTALLMPGQGFMSQTYAAPASSYGMYNFNGRY